MKKMNEESLDTKTLLLFFIPLGASASLVSLSHLIINSTLARAEQSEMIIASYAVAMSLFSITERLAVILRQTCSSLVRDRGSFKLMSVFTMYLILSLLIVSLAIAYSPVGDFIFATIYGVKDSMVVNIKDIYQVLIFVTVFSALRCLSHGIIIFNRQTKWLTFGMVIRLIGMYVLSLYFIETGNISGRTGAYIFLTGMFIECIVSIIEARSLVRRMPVTTEQEIRSKQEIFQFYSPLMLSSIITVIIGPAINIFLGKTENIELAIASYALAFGVVQLFLSFFSYMHQIVINFYEKHQQKVKVFALVIGFLPGILLFVFCYTPTGTLFLEKVMGISGRLLAESLQVLKVFMIMAIVFPFIDFFNGLLMVQKQTRVTIISQSTNLLVTVIVLTTCVFFASAWNGIIGALAQSLGMLGELIVVSAIVNAREHTKGRDSIFKIGRLSKEG